MKKKKLFYSMLICGLAGILCGPILYAALVNTYDTATPAGTDDPREADDRMRETKAAVQERMNDHDGTADEGDHYWPLSGTEVSDSDSGHHRKITFVTQTDDPDALTSYSTITDMGFLYTKDSAEPKAELFWEDEDGDVIQLTSGGYLNGAVLKADTVNATMIEFANNTYLTQKDSGATARNVIGMDGSNIIQVGNATTTDVRLVTATSGATAHDRQIADKGYVDTQVATKGLFDNLAGAAVFSDTFGAANTFEDLDLSGTVGSNAALCFFQVLSTTNTIIVSMRPKGEGYAPGAGDGVYHGSDIDNANQGCAQAYIPVNKYVYLTCMTNADGIVQIAGSATARSITISLLGYVK